MFSFNFNENYLNKNIEKIKNRKQVWFRNDFFSFDLFKLERTDRNLKSFFKGQSIFVIIIMTIALIYTILKS